MRAAAARVEDAIDKEALSALEGAEQLLRAFADAVPTLPWGKRP